MLLPSIALFVIFIYSVVLHEVAHGFMARALGDTTAERLGRLTLNPLKHLDPIGSVALPFLLYVLNSPFLFGYAKPVPYDPSQLRDRRYGPAKVALAGPATNIILAVLAGAVFRIFQLDTGTIMGMLVGYMVWINLMLAFFNLIPVPPLDGHWLLITLLPRRYHAFKAMLYRAQWVLLFAVLFFIFPLLMPLFGKFFTLLTGAAMF
jgi:Zn-dependent protease